MTRSRNPEQRDRKFQPPRPPNAWILYRSSQYKELRKTQTGLSQASISKIIADKWKHESESVRRHFEQEAEAKKAQHQELYPGYRYCPQRKEPKQNNKKSKALQFTAPSEDDQVYGSDNGKPSPPVLALAIPHSHPPQSRTRPCPLPAVPYRQNAVMPQHLTMPHFPEAHYGPAGPSPPISSAPSPHGCSDSSLSPPSTTSSSLSSSAQPSPVSDASSPPLHLPAHPIYPPPPHHPSPNPYATLPLSAMLFQNSILDELSVTSPRLQLRSTENTVSPTSPTWGNFSAYLPGHSPQNSEEAVNIHQSFDFRQNIPPGSFESLQALLSSTDESGVFNLSNIESSTLLSQPQGDLEVCMGAHTLSPNYCKDLFADSDVAEFQRQFESLKEGRPSSPTPISRVQPEKEIQSLFHTLNDLELQAYTAAQQRQPSAFTQDMMNFLNFEDAAEGVAPAVPPTPALVPDSTTGAAPQQVHLQNLQAALAMPIFTQMTNTASIPSDGSFVPPAGTIYSSTRRVVGSWKPSFVDPHSQMDELVPL